MIRYFPKNVCYGLTALAPDSQPIKSKTKKTSLIDCACSPALSTDCTHFRYKEIAKFKKFFERLKYI